MSTAQIAHTRPSATVPVTIRAAQLLLLGPLGAAVAGGSIYFTLTESAHAVDWLVGAWAFALAMGNLYAGARLAGGQPALRRAALALLAAHLAFGIVKVVGYGEGEAATFMAIDLIAIALLCTPAARRFSARRRRPHAG